MKKVRTKGKIGFHFPEQELIGDENSGQIWQVVSSSMEGIMETSRASNKIHGISFTMEKRATVRWDGKMKALICIHLGTLNSRILSR